MSADQVSLQRDWKRTFGLIWIGQAFSLLGSQLVQFALIWYLTEKTGSAAVLATATFVEIIPRVVLGPFAGALVDRWNRKRVMIVADALIAVFVVCLGALFFFNLIHIWHIYVLIFLRALGGAFHWPAMRASTSLLVPEKHLSRVAGMNSALQGVLSIGVPPMAAILLKSIPMYAILAIDVTTATLAILPLLFAHIPQPDNSDMEALTSPRVLINDVRFGFKYLISWKGMFILGLSAALVNFLLNPAFTLLPLLVTKYFQKGVVELGLMESLFGIGVISGGLLLGVWGGFKKKILTTYLGVFGVALGVFIVAFAPADLFNMALAGMLVTGVMISLTNGPLFAVMQSAVPANLQGRVFTAIESTTSFMSPIGMLAAAPVAEWLGVRGWFFLAALGCVCMGLLGLASHDVMDIEEQGKARQQAAQNAR